MMILGSHINLDEVPLSSNIGPPVFWNKGSTSSLLKLVKEGRLKRRMVRWRLYQRNLFKSYWKECILDNEILSISKRQGEGIKLTYSFIEML
eukprot:c37533_g1_i1 orf=276-551(+)